MKSLMVHVERAVRPVRAEESTKCTMREEIYAHLLAIYEEELQRTGDEASAIECSLRRLGSPAELTAELQETVCYVEPYIARLDRCFHRRVNESAARHTLRHMIWAAFFMFVLMTFARASLNMLSGLGWIDTVGRSFPSPIAYGLIVWITLMTGAFTVLGYGMRQQLNASWRPRSIPAAIGLATASLMLVLVSGFALMYFASTNARESLWLTLRFGVLACFTTIGLVVASRLAAKEYNRSEPWRSLDLSE